MSVREPRGLHVFHIATSGEKAAYEALGRFILEWGKLDFWLHVHLLRSKNQDEWKTRAKLTAWSEKVQSDNAGNESVIESIKNVESLVVELNRTRNRLLHAGLVGIREDGSFVMEYAYYKKREPFYCSVTELLGLCEKVVSLKEEINWLANITPPR